MTKTIILKTMLFKQKNFGFALFFFCISLFSYSQGGSKASNEFWRHVQFGGGIGLSIGSGFTNISLAPSAIYNFNSSVAAGVGLQGSFVKSRDDYKSYIYGGSLIGLFTPIEKIQLSVELEQLRVNQEFTILNLNRDFWNTALYVGAGYQNQNVTVGIRYNVLFDKNDFVYNEAFMPFVRVYF